MNDTNTASDLDQADDEILTYTVSDEALEAAAGTEKPSWTTGGAFTWGCSDCC